MFSSHTFNNNYQLFFKGFCFTHIEGAFDECIGMDIMVVEAACVCILLMHKLLHKFFLHPTIVQANGERSLL